MRRDFSVPMRHPIQSVELCIYAGSANVPPRQDVDDLVQAALLPHSLGFTHFVVLAFPRG
jgi:hypothetical protein